MAKIDKEIVDQLLWHSFMMMTDTAAAYGDDTVSAASLLGLLFNHAVEMEWIEEPPDGNYELGDWYVSEECILQFMRRLLFLGDKVNLEFVKQVRNTMDLGNVYRGDSELSLLETLSDDLDDLIGKEVEYQTNPAKIIESFCKAYRLHPSTSFIKLLAPKESIDAPCPTMQRRVLRLMEEPDSRKRTSVRPNRSQWRFAEFMRETMVAYDTVRPMGDLSDDDVPPKKKFVGLTAEELLWIRYTVQRQQAQKEH
jgi:hypothetical protein